jgi:hypothetical protein
MKGGDLGYMIVNPKKITSSRIITENIPEILLKHFSKKDQAKLKRYKKRKFKASKIQPFYTAPSNITNEVIEPPSSTPKTKSKGRPPRKPAETEETFYTRDARPKDYPSPPSTAPSSPQTTPRPKTPRTFEGIKKGFVRVFIKGEERFATAPTTKVDKSDHSKFSKTEYGKGNTALTDKLLPESQVDFNAFRNKSPATKRKVLNGLAKRLGRSMYKRLDFEGMDEDDALDTAYITELANRDKLKLAKVLVKQGQITDYEDFTTDLTLLFGIDKSSDPNAPNPRIPPPLPPRPTATPPPIPIKAKIMSAAEFTLKKAEEALDRDRKKHNLKSMKGALLKEANKRRNALKEEERKAREALEAQQKEEKKSKKGPPLPPRPTERERQIKNLPPLLTPAEAEIRAEQRLGEKKASDKYGGRKIAKAKADAPSQADLKQLMTTINSPRSPREGPPSPAKTTLIPGGRRPAPPSPQGSPIGVPSPSQKAKAVALMADIKRVSKEANARNKVAISLQKRIRGMLDRKKLTALQQAKLRQSVEELVANVSNFGAIKQKATEGLKDMNVGQLPPATAAALHNSLSNLVVEGARQNSNDETAYSLQSIVDGIGDEAELPIEEIKQVVKRYESNDETIGKLKAIANATPKSKTPSRPRPAPSVLKDKKGFRKYLSTGDVTALKPARTKSADNLARLSGDLTEFLSEQKKSNPKRSTAAFEEAQEALSALAAVFNPEVESGLPSPERAELAESTARASRTSTEMWNELTRGPSPEAPAGRPEIASIDLFDILNSPQEVSRASTEMANAAANPLEAGLSTPRGTPIFAKPPPVNTLAEAERRAKAAAAAQKYAARSRASRVSKARESRNSLSSVPEEVLEMTPRESYAPTKAYLDQPEVTPPTPKRRPTPTRGRQVSAEELEKRGLKGRSPPKLKGEASERLAAYRKSKSPVVSPEETPATSQERGAVPSTKRKSPKVSPSRNNLEAVAAEVGPKKAPPTPRQRNKTFKVVEPYKIEEETAGPKTTDTIMAEFFNVPSKELAEYMGKAEPTPVRGRPKKLKGSTEKLKKERRNLAHYVKSVEEYILSRIGISVKELEERLKDEGTFSQSIALRIQDLVDGMIDNIQHGAEFDEDLRAEADREADALRAEIDTFNEEQTTEPAAALPSVRISNEDPITVAEQVQEIQKELGSVLPPPEFLPEGVRPLDYKRLLRASKGEGPAAVRASQDLAELNKAIVRASREPESLTNLRISRAFDEGNPFLKKYGETPVGSPRTYVYDTLLRDKFDGIEKDLNDFLETFGYDPKDVKTWTAEKNKKELAEIMKVVEEEEESPFQGMSPEQHLELVLQQLGIPELDIETYDQLSQKSKELIDLFMSNDKTNGFDSKEERDQALSKIKKTVSQEGVEQVPRHEYRRYKTLNRLGYSTDYLRKLSSQYAVSFNLKSMEKELKRRLKEDPSLQSKLDEDYKRFETKLTETRAKFAAFESSSEEEPIESIRAQRRIEEEAIKEAASKQQAKLASKQQEEEDDPEDVPLAELIKQSKQKTKGSGFKRRDRFGGDLMADQGEPDISSDDGGGSDQSASDSESDSENEEYYNKLSHSLYNMPMIRQVRHNVMHPAMMSPSTNQVRHPNAEANLMAFHGGALKDDLQHMYHQAVPKSLRPALEDLGKDIGKHVLRNDKIRAARRDIKKGYEKAVPKSMRPAMAELGKDALAYAGRRASGGSIKSKLMGAYHKAVPKSLRPAVEDLAKDTAKYAVRSKPVRKLRREAKEGYEKAVPKSLRPAVAELAKDTGNFAKRQAGFGLKKGSEEARKFMASLRARKGKGKGGAIPAPPSRSPITNPEFL